MLIAQLSDTHIKRPDELAYGQVDTADHLRRAIAHLNALAPRPDIVLFTGDLTDHGTAAQMDHACSLMSALENPVLPVPGNHDDRSRFAAHFPGLARQASGTAFSYIADRGPLRFVMLDSSVPGQPHGQLGQASLDLLREALDAKPARPIIIAVHHPPVQVGIGHMDCQNLRDAEGLAEIISAAPHVLAVVCGHIHRTIHTRFAGTSVIVAPSPAHAVTLDLAPAAPPTFRMEPPAVLLHQWQPQPGPFGQLVTHVSQIGDHGTEHPFFDGNGRLLE